MLLMQIKTLLTKNTAELVNYIKSRCRSIISNNKTNYYRLENLFHLILNIQNTNANLE